MTTITVHVEDLVPSADLIAKLVDVEGEALVGLANNYELVWSELPEDDTTPIDLFTAPRFYEGCLLMAESHVAALLLAKCLVDIGSESHVLRTRDSSLGRRYFVLSAVDVSHRWA